MSFFISDAMAEGGAAAGQAGGSLAGMIPLLLIFVIMYFLLIRPQVKRAKEHKKLTESIAKGDEVVTSGGILGKVADAGESFITLEVADNLTIKVQRHAVASLVPKGTIKSA
ncbi:MAG: preprotein translocase subunit YajC [Gammaproteobacteria bacterium]|nr:preprotein translocase subunit YajC [Gammaproteobacteria bacterium]MDH5728622.1 preprotein translocase subunit YajC [Gammaproteobacteria bacterium]